VVMNAVSPALTQLGRFRITGELGRGAMGIVYRAEDPLLARTVAIKTIIMSHDAGDHDEYEARFYQEARAAGGMSHPGIITVYDIGREGDIAYIAMELLEGAELRELMKLSRVPLAMAIDLAAQVADALSFAHARGVVHRDVKPGNIMILPGQRAKIMDFGIARVRVSDIKTQTGMLMGSPKYMSPEQIAGSAVDHRADIFSLGVVLYELVTGVAPFGAADLTQLMHQVSAGAPRAPSELDPALPPTLDLILAKALAKERDARYQDASELAADLRSCAADLVVDTETAEAAETQRGDATLARSPSHTASLSDVTLMAPAESTLRIASMGEISQAGMIYSPSRRFDSSAALARLGGMEGAGAPPAGETLPARAGRWLEDPEKRVLVAAISTALVLAVLIALL
jgi:serine/threonine protein kinase